MVTLSLARILQRISSSLFLFSVLIRDPYFSCQKLQALFGKQAKYAPKCVLWLYFLLNITPYFQNGTNKHPFCTLGAYPTHWSQRTPQNNCPWKHLGTSFTCSMTRKGAGGIPSTILEKAVEEDSGHRALVYQREPEFSAKAKKMFLALKLSLRLAMGSFNSMFFFLQESLY